MGLNEADREFFKKQKTFLGTEKEKGNTFFNKDNIDAMKDSNYFERKGVFGVYDPRNPNAPVETGSPELNKKFEKGDGKGFLDNVIEGGLDYFKKNQKSEEDKDRDLLRDLARQSGEGMKFGDFGGGGFKEVAQGLTYGQLAPQTQQMFIPGEKATGKSLVQRFAGGIVGLGKGLMTGTPHGGAFGFASGFFG